MEFSANVFATVIENGEVPVDVLHAKVAADLLLRSELTEAEFYNQCSCDWLQFFRTVLKGGRSAKASSQSGPVAILRENGP